MTAVVTATPPRTNAYQAVAEKRAGVSAYCLSMLQDIAAGKQPANGETAQEYAQRHLATLLKLGYIEVTS